MSPTRSAYTGKKRGRKPGSKNKTSSVKQQQQGSAKANGDQKEEKSKDKKGKPMSKEEEILSMKGPFIHIEGSWNSPNYVSLSFMKIFQVYVLKLFNQIDSGERCEQLERHHEETRPS